MSPEQKDEVMCWLILLIAFTIVILTIFAINERRIMRELKLVEQKKDILHCEQWDSFIPREVYLNGRCIGVLQPRLTQEQLRASPGLQGWSAPNVETRQPGD